MQCKINPKRSLAVIPRKHEQSPPKPSSYYDNRYERRSEAMADAYGNGHYTLAEVGRWFVVSYATVSRAIKAIRVQKVRINLVTHLLDFMTHKGLSGNIHKNHHVRFL
jgi:hypothetical protein